MTWSLHTQLYHWLPDHEIWGLRGILDTIQFKYIIFADEGIQAQEEEGLRQGLVAVESLSSEDHQVAEASL